MSLLDGLVMVSSAFRHSFNYRPVVIFGRPEAVEDAAEKRRVLRLFVERVAPGRWEELRPATDQEIKGTGVVRLSLTEASAKIRTGPPSTTKRTTAIRCGPASCPSPWSVAWSSPTPASPRALTSPPISPSRSR